MVFIDVLIERIPKAPACVSKLSKGTQRPRSAAQPFFKLSRATVRMQEK